MTITDLRKYAERMNAKASPTDKYNVTLDRAAMTYIGAFLSDRKASVEQSLSDPKISPQKRLKREYELIMINAAIGALDKAKQM